MTRTDADNMAIAALLFIGLTVVFAVLTLLPPDILALFGKVCLIILSASCGLIAGAIMGPIRW